MDATLDQEWLKEIMQKVETKVQRMLVTAGDKSPHASASGIYDDEPLDWWTSGFWPGMQWILHELTGREEYRAAAWGWDARLEEYFARENKFHHDLGFQFLPTAVIKYRLTGDPDARRRGLQAANALAGRFNPAGGFIRAWNEDRIGWSIIDTMMNLSLLFWAAAETTDPRFKHVARIHAETVLRHFIRDDGSVRHIARFDPESGEYLDSLGGQGFGPDSAWSRGQAWAIYGLANTHGYTADMRFLRAAQRVADFVLPRLPDDLVPYWDFRVPSFAGEPRDSSAAAITASGLLELAKYLPPEEARFYGKWARGILRSLIENYSTLEDPGYEGILLQATGNKPSGKNINVSLIYGDYYFLEALAKLLGWEGRVF